MLIVRLTAILVFFVLLIDLSFHRPLLERFLFAVALAVGLTPESLADERLGRARARRYPHGQLGAASR